MRSAILDNSASHIVVQEYSTGLHPCTERTSSLTIIHITKLAQIFWQVKICCPIALVLAWHLDYHRLESQVQIKLKIAINLSL